MKIISVRPFFPQSLLHPFGEKRKRRKKRKKKNIKKKENKKKKKYNFTFSWLGPTSSPSKLRNTRESGFTSILSFFLLS